MNIILALFLSLIGLLSIITLHELGHFIVAKLSGAYVYEFALGFGPRLFTIKGQETWFSVRLLPLGGYVSLAMDAVDPPKGRENEVVPDERKMEYLPLWKRSFFILSGPLTNLLFAIFIITTIFMATMSKPNDMTFFGQRLSPNGIAYQLIAETEQKETLDQQGYIILGWETKTEQEEVIDHLDLQTKQNSSPTYETIVYSFIDHFKNEAYENPNIVISFHYAQFDYQNHKQVSNAKWTTFSDFQNWQADGAKTSVGVSAPTRYFLTRGEAYQAGWKQVGQDSLALVKAFGKVFTGNVSGLSGPVGIAKSGAQVTSTPTIFFLNLGALSANLFMLNFLPFPPLDGYKFVEACWEKSRKKAIQPKVKTIIMAVGIGFLVLLFIIVTIKDIIGG